MSASAPPVDVASHERARRLSETVFRVRELGIVLALALLIVVTAIIEPRFIHLGSLQDLARNASIYAVMAAGQTLVLVTKNVDLSVGSVLGLSAFLTARLASQTHGLPLVLVFLVGLGIGLLCGVANGLMVTLGRVPSLVVTLATLYIIRGVDVLIVGGGQVVPSSYYPSFLNMSKATVAGIPDLAIVVAVVIAGGWYWLRTYRSGRELYAIGSNPDAARLAGIPMGRRVFTAFALSGAIAGVAGVLWASRFGTVDSTAGAGYELQVVAAVVVGGVAIFGGSGSVVGAAIGALLLQTINSALYVLGVSPNWDQAIAGFLLILAIVLDRIISLRLTASLRRRSARRGT
jgi:rhamnose transport system permease protein